MVKNLPKINYTYESIIKVLNSLGYKDLKRISTKTIAVLTNQNREQVLQRIHENIVGSEYDKTPSSRSSVGMVRIKQYNIVVLAKPLKRQGNNSAGIKNEIMLIDYVKNSLKVGPTDIIFFDGKKQFKIKNCVSIKPTGKDTAGRKKSDVILVDSNGKPHPISIKQDNAEFWESSDRLFAPVASKIIEKQLKKGTIKLVLTENYYTIIPNIAVKASPQEVEDAVFGSDIKQNGGCVITRTFNPNDFIDDIDGLRIEVSDIIRKSEDIKPDKEVYFIIRNEKARKSIPHYPGLRVQAVYKKRINKNVLIIDR